MGFYHLARQQLASAHLVVTHAGLRIVRPQRRRPSFCQPVASRGKRGSAVWAAASIDEPVAAQRLCRRAVCVVPGACGIRRVDFRTQGRVEHVLRAADAAGLCQSGDK